MPDAVVFFTPEDMDYMLVHEKELDQYSAILTQCLLSNPYSLVAGKRKKLL